LTGYSGLVGGSGFGSTTANAYVLGDGTGATVTATITAGSVTGLTITNGGSNYTWAVIGVYDPTGAAAPQYGGTCYTAEGIQRTLTVTIGAWRDPGNLAAMLLYAYDLYATVCDTIVEGSVRYLGLYTAALTPGMAVNVTGSTYTTGWENLTSIPGYPGLAVVCAELEWPQGHGSNWITTLHCTSRRAQGTSAAFMRPDRTGISLTGSFGGEGGLLGSLASPGISGSS
jgi:hypothetical protein